MSDLISRQAAIEAVNTYLGLSAVSRTIQNMTSVQEILENLPSVEPEYKELQDWKTDFKGFIDALDMPRDDYCGIMEYINEVPSAEPEHLVKESGDLVKDLVNDCINRQDAVKTMYDACEDIDDESLHIDVIVDALENLPFASPDLSDFSDKLWKIAYERGKAEGRKKGKWIDETFKPWGLVYHPYKCDQCGEHSEADSDFCPNCGSYNGGEEDGNK